MLKISSNLFCLVLITTLVVGCTKYKEPPPENLGFFSLGEAKDYLLFKPGTWWVYKNSITNELDSMLLIKCKLDTTECVSKIRYFTYENIKYSIESSRDQCSYLNYSNDWSADNYDFYPRWSFSTFAYNGNYMKLHSYNYGSDCHFYYPFTTSFGSNQIDSWYSTYFINSIDSMHFSGKNYYNIVCFRVPKDNSFPYPKEDMGEDGYSLYYWAKGVGLISIKHQIFVNINGNYTETFMYWNLIESHIIK